MSDIEDAEVNKFQNAVLVDPDIKSLLNHHLQLLGDEQRSEKRKKCFGYGEDKSVPHHSGCRKNKRPKFREVDYRHTNPQLTQLQPIESSTGDQIQYHWTTSTEVHRHVEQTTEFGEFSQVEPIRIESQWTELQQAQTQWVELQKVEVEPQWSECLLVEPPQATPVLLTPIETAQAQYAQIQEVTEVRVVKKIRIYEEIIEETYE